MAIKIVRKGNSSVANDHNLLFNRGSLNQHPIESISGLTEELASKYEKPTLGIPPSDLAFDVVTAADLNNATSILEQKILVIKSEVVGVTSRVEVLEELMSLLVGDDGTTEDSTIKFAFRNGFREDFISEDGDTTFNLSNKYIVDGKHLRVYRDGELLTPNVDYDETGDNAVTMKYVLDEGVFMTFICDSMSNVLSPVHEEVLSTEHQSVFTLKNRYNTGEHSLSIYVNGVRLECNRHYREVSSDTVELLIKPFDAGTLLIFRQEIVTTAGKVLYHDKEYNQKSWVFETVATDGQKEIVLDEVFIPGSNMINVFCDGLLMWCGIAFDYLEENEHTIKFNYGLEEGSLVRVICVAATQEWTQRIIANDKQTVIKLTNPYYVGRYDIQVYEQGLLLQPEWDYIETNYNTITFNDALQKGAHITVVKRR